MVPNVPSPAKSPMFLLSLDCGNRDESYCANVQKDLSLRFVHILYSIFSRGKALLMFFLFFCTLGRHTFALIGSMVNRIYPSELQLNKALYLNLHLSIPNGFS